MPMDRWKQGEANMKDITYLLDAEAEFKRLTLYKINHIQITNIILI